MKRVIQSLVLVAAGAVIALAWTAVVPDHRNGSGTADAGAAAKPAAAAEVWTCSMHPQIRMDHKDICPLCGMDLTPVKADSDGGGPTELLSLGERARMMARVATAEVRRRELFKEIRTVGRVELDETRVAFITARVDGRVDQVFADFPGTPIKRGEHVVSIYSPELYSSQVEYLNAVKRKSEQQSFGGTDLGSSLAAGSRRRLQLWGLTDQQLDELTQRGKAETHLTVYAPIGGTVIEKNVRVGQYVKEGDTLYTIADLSQVWLVLEIYESELSWVRLGQPVQVTLESEPTRPVAATVAFIEPLLNQDTRSVRVRAILKNTEGKFKPGMYAHASLRIPIMSDGHPAPTGLEGKYVCPMHPYDVSDKPGDCTVCGMPRELVPATGGPNAPQATPTVLAVPADAVLTTGRRQLVYVEREPGKYQLVEPKLGPRTGDFYPVLDGLSEGDRVVVRGNFLLDSQFQITGRASLLYPEGSTGTGGHGAHGGAAQTAQLSAKDAANLEKLPAADREAAQKQKICPVTGLALGSMGTPYKMTVGDRTIFLCCKGCEAAVKKDPEGTLKKLQAASEAGHEEHGK